MMKILANSAALGIQRGMAAAQRDAAKVVEATTPSDRPESKQASLEKAMVGLIQDGQQVSASAKAMKTQDEILGTLLDIKA